MNECNKCKLYLQTCSSLRWQSVLSGCSGSSPAPPLSLIMAASFGQVRPRVRQKSRSRLSSPTNKQTCHCHPLIRLTIQEDLAETHKVSISCIYGVDMGGTSSFIFNICLMMIRVCNLDNQNYNLKLNLGFFKFLFTLPQTEFKILYHRNVKTIDALSLLKSFLFQRKNVRLFLNIHVLRFYILLAVNKWCFC